MDIYLTNYRKWFKDAETVSRWSESFPVLADSPSVHYTVHFFGMNGPLQRRRWPTRL